MAAADGHGGGGGDAAVFSSMIGQMLSPQNEQRQAAEQAFAEAKKQPDLCASSLIMLLRRSDQTDSRALCAVLLRKVLCRPCKEDESHRRCQPAFDTLRADAWSRLVQILTKEDPSLWPALSPGAKV